MSSKIPFAYGVVARTTVPSISPSLRPVQLCEKKMEAIYLNLPMARREAAELAGQLAEHGFLFSSVIPELDNGDVLKLQYLNNVQIDPAKIAVVSETARDLLDFIVQQYRERA
ncbi:hypothetical protein SAMN05660860_00703 [Geoalkalibacter ferrihydriticus]|uniref:Uncharacterized protein n=2 Tax=Geoalkalibacter ferrihydriticus TaxID=392333 RepID=A0A0C2HPK1_9BACT|nr:hypothetical protein [Geoalkalibacter ferrihydriticus]KIH76875.1 hypothetical protein GFER_07170 [Geoalkalibacter ferrihydriticus DSM 17813]SDL46618.1 hypothetical protein SAMN05660860_00703 [Geoalkalibacter ferrihydriticus]